MKKLTFLSMLLISVSFLFGQVQTTTTQDGKTSKLNPNDCANWIETVEDEVSGETYTTMLEPLFVSSDNMSNNFVITLRLDGQVKSLIKTRSPVILKIELGDGICIDTGDIIAILFTDGTRMELSDGNGFNCGGLSAVWFGGFSGKKKQLRFLSTKKIDIIRVWTSDNSYVEGVLTSSQEERLMDAFNCLSKKMKTQMHQ